MRVACWSVQIHVVHKEGHELYPLGRKPCQPRRTQIRIICIQSRSWYTQNLINVLNDKTTLLTRQHSKRVEIEFSSIAPSTPHPDFQTLSPWVQKQEGSRRETRLLIEWVLRTTREKKIPHIYNQIQRSSAKWWIGYSIKVGSRLLEATHFDYDVSFYTMQATIAIPSQQDAAWRSASLAIARTVHWTASKYRNLTSTTSRGNFL